MSGLSSQPGRDADEDPTPGAVPKRVAVEVPAPETGTSVVIGHNLDSEWVTVQLFNTETKEQIITGVDYVDSNHVSISFPTAPAAGEYTAVVTG